MAISDKISSQSAWHICYNMRVQERHYFVYILTNKMQTVLYTGVTNDLRRRVYEHKEKFVDGFTKRYRVDKLIYYEVAENAESAILREKRIKSGRGSARKSLLLL